MNIELLEKVKEKILAEPKLFTMVDWEEEGDKGFCNTAHCICGWAVVIEEKMSFFDAFYNSEYKWETDFGMGILDLTNDRLFHVHLWPKELEEKYNSYTWRKKKAEVAVEAIDSYIATNGWQDEKSL